MRICLISREYPPDTGWGGIGAYTFQHAQGLKRLGHDVEVIALAKEEITSESQISKTDNGDIKVHRSVWGPLLRELSTINLIAPYTFTVLRCSLALWQQFLKVHRNNPFDVVEAPEHLAEGILPALTKICPLVLRLHTPHSKFVAERYHNLVPSFDLQTVANFERAAMLEADVLSSPSVDMAGYVARDCGYDLSKIEIVRNPVDAGNFAPEGKRAIAYDGQPIVFFAGRLEERKGIYHLIDAVPKVLERCPQAKFVIVGSDTNTAAGQKSVLTELKERLTKSGSLAAVNFVGKVPLAEMADYYRSADICVVSSLYDNAPYTVLEAMACGKPIVGCATGGIPEYIADGKTGVVVPPANPDLLADAISALIADEPRRRTYGAAARERILECFEQNVIARQAVATYELAVSRFQYSKDHALYRKAPEEAAQDFVATLYSVHESLTDMMYLHAARWNRERWMHMLEHRPKLFFAKLCLAVMRVVGRVPGLGSAARSIAGRLESGVASKEKEIKDAMRERLYGFFDVPATLSDASLPAGHVALDHLQSIGH
jgi:glycosyltransferase involved in cell wall biosynthesis